MPIPRRVQSMCALRSVRAGLGVVSFNSLGSPCRRVAISSGPARDASTRARRRTACHARATGPPLRQGEPPSHPPVDALVGFLRGAKEPPHHGSKED
jgi:hypothetical protein